MCAVFCVHSTHQVRIPVGLVLPCTLAQGSLGSTRPCLWTVDLTMSSKCFLGGKERPLISTCTHD